MRDVSYSMGANYGEYHENSHHALPSLFFTPQLWYFPTDTWDHAPLPDTGVGTFLLVVEPTPSWPSMLSPQPVGYITRNRDVSYSMGANYGEYHENSHHALPSLFFTPHVWRPPADIWDHAPLPDTAVGTFLPVVEPTPSWPYPFQPQPALWWCISGCAYRKRVIEETYNTRYRYLQEHRYADSQLWWLPLLTKLPGRSVLQEIERCMSCK